ncbi:hypothetical protein C8Q76DRAFT_608913, partial [Earliella scabrosa]
IQRARKHVFQGHSIKSGHVENLLFGRSLIPIQCAFSQKLSRFGLNCYELFAPDLLHEFELGVRKKVFDHLMRILQTQSDAKLTELNRRHVHVTKLH